MSTKTASESTIEVNYQEFIKLYTSSKTTKLNRLKTAEMNEDDKKETTSLASKSNETTQSYLPSELSLTRVSSMDSLSSIDSLSYEEDAGYSTTSRDDKQNQTINHRTRHTSGSQQPCR